MPTISTEHPDILTSRHISQCLKAAEREASPLQDRRQFYWRLIYYCSSQIVPSESSYCHSKDEDPSESACVANTIGQFDRILARLDEMAAERILFYKRLHQALADHVYDLECRHSNRADQPFEHNRF